MPQQHRVDNIINFSQNKFSIIGLIIGTLALLTGLIFQKDIEAEAFKTIELIYIIGGSIGIVLSVIGFLRKEDINYCMVAGIISFVAAIFSYIIVALIIAVILLVLWGYIKLGGD
jgi:hypothetical protein